MRSCLGLVACVLVFAMPSAGADVQQTLASQMNLRGPVKQCVEQTIYPAVEGFPERTVTTTMTFSPVGQLVQQRLTQNDGPESLTTYSYDSSGRLLKTSDSNSPQRGWQYEYDQQGRLTATKSNSGQLLSSYEYDGTRLTRRVVHYPMIPQQPNTAVASIHWENGDVAFPPPSGGTVTTIFDDKDRPIRAEIRDENGTLRRIVREYDDKGRVLSEVLTSEDVEQPLPQNIGEAFAAQLNDAQQKALARLINGAFGTSTATYKYDPAGRVIEKRVAGGVLGEQVTKFEYDDYGHVSDEVITNTPDPDMHREFEIDDLGSIILQGEAKAPNPTTTRAHYDYEYDSHGNWTKKTTTWRADGSSEFPSSETVRRTITYYDQNP